jgi:transcriptional regulator with XRE-family HTH domain
MAHRQQQSTNVSVRRLRIGCLSHPASILGCVGYRGKVDDRQRARERRAEGWTLVEIADELGVSKSSVSVWVRDVEFLQRPRKAARRRAPNRLQIAKADEIAALLAAGRERVGQLTEREFLMAGVALYAGEGAKGEGGLRFANADPRMIVFFCHWVRHFFDIDEARMRLKLYLHQGLDLDAANRYWSELTGIPIAQFQRPYRAIPNHSIRHTKHLMGCPAVRYSCTRTHRSVMGLVHALLTCDALPSGVAQLAEQRTVNALVVGSSPTPGASTSS